LVKEEIVNSGAAALPAGTIDYTAQTGGFSGYDAVGNRQSRVVSLTPSISGFATGSSTFDADDRLTSATYHFNGNTRRRQCHLLT